MLHIFCKFASIVFMSLRKYLFYILILLNILIFLSIFTLCLVPPVSIDALDHHLAVPKLYLEHGLFTNLFHIKFSFYPQLLQLIYTFCLYLGNDILPKLVHFGFALGTAALIFYYLKSRLSRLYALLGCLFFLSLPVIIRLSFTVYVDLGLIFFSFASLLFLVIWKDKEFKLNLQRDDFGLFSGAAGVLL